MGASGDDTARGMLADAEVKLMTVSFFESQSVTCVCVCKCCQMLKYVCTRVCVMQAKVGELVRTKMFKDPLIESKLYKKIGRRDAHVLMAWTVYQVCAWACVYVGECLCARVFASVCTYVRACTHVPLQKIA